MSYSYQRAVPVVAAALLLVAAPASAGPGTLGPLDKVSGASPLAACTSDDVAAQSGDNFPNSEVEPWIASSSVDRSGDGVADLIAGYQQDRWSNGGARGVFASVLHSGVWQQVAIPGVSTCLGGTELRATDPWVTISPDGTAYFMTLSIGDPDVDPTSVMYVNRSTDGGLTWGPPIELIRDVSSFLFNDKNSMTADPFDSRFVYAIWDRSRFPSDVREFRTLAGFPASFRSDAMFTRSTDGGASWEPARPIFQPRANQFGIGHQIVVLSDGTLVDGFMLFHGSGRNTKGQEIAVMISRDRGGTWTEPIRVAKALPGFVSDPDDGFPLRTGDIIPEIAAGPNGSVYMVWQEATLAPSGSAIAFSKSLDGGLTWSEPVRINTRSDVQAFTPSIEVLPDGTIAVTHYDLRNNTPDPATLPTDYWFLHSHDGGVTWNETRVTPTSFDGELAPIARGYFLGDYMGLAVRSGGFMAAFTQTEPTDPASIFVRRLIP
jgi:BNR repeat-like domain